MIHDKFLIYNICYFLENQDIFNLQKVCKYYNTITQDKVFKNNIRFRYHPAVFNLFDNFCTNCNLKLLVFTDFDTTFSRCNCLTPSYRH